MVFIDVQKDKEWVITEERLRFPVNAEVPPSLVPVAIAKDLVKSIDILEKLRHWKMIETVPTHRRILTPCCTQIMGKAGALLNIRFQPSALQADTDDAHNSQDSFDTEGTRLFKENIIDWVAIIHFWTPAIWVDPDVIREESLMLSEKDGFVSPDRLPAGLLEKNRRWDGYFKRRNK